MCHNFLIHSSIDGHLGCFHVLAVVNSATMNSGIHVSFSILVSSGYMPRSGIAGSYGGFIPEFLKKKKEGKKKKTDALHLIALRFLSEFQCLGCHAFTVQGMASKILQASR